MKIKRKEGFFSISAVAKMFSVHQQTIRLYEKQGLINPKRSSGNTRLFSEEDINRLEEIIYLTHELGINLAGVEVIFKLKRQIKKMQKEMNALFDQAKEQLDSEALQSQHTIQQSAQRLIQIKHEQDQKKLDPQEKPSAEPKVEMDNWEIDYED